MMKILVYAAISLLIMAQSVIAGDKLEAEELLKNKLNAVFILLQKKELDAGAKEKEIVETLTPMFDFKLMAKLTLGRKYWPGLPPEKKDQFTNLFIKRLKTTYLDKLALYTDEKVSYEPPVQDKKKVHISTFLISENRRTSILYKFYNSTYGWKVYDLEIEGISIIRSYRSQFSQILENGTIDDLLLKMEKPDNK
jgi:phospholipid transport system substrate-binding protein